jgi:hypothetical protein
MEKSIDTYLLKLENYARSSIDFEIRKQKIKIMKKEEREKRNTFRN